MFTIICGVIFIICCVIILCLGWDEDYSIIAFLIGFVAAVIAFAGICNAIFDALDTTNKQEELDNLYQTAIVLIEAKKDSPNLEEVVKNAVDEYNTLLDYCIHENTNNFSGILVNWDFCNDYSPIETESYEITYNFTYKLPE